MSKKTIQLPKQSPLIVILCLFLQMCAVVQVYFHVGFSIWGVVLAIFLATYLADLVTAIFHFGFDYVWPDDFPVMGPISVEFRAHHDAPELDPSAWVSNLTRGAYMGITFVLLSLWAGYNSIGEISFFISATLLGVSLWGLFFHQIHSYAHMGKIISSEEFNSAVEKISRLPKNEGKKKFAELFREAGIPKHIRVLQRCRLMLRPEIHWRHHHTFESDFSSLNGWSDPLTNLIFGPLARRKKKRIEELQKQAYSHDRDSKLA